MSTATVDSSAADPDRYLRVALTQALYRRQLGRICSGESTEISGLGTLSAVAVVLGMALSVFFWLFFYAGFGLWIALSAAAVWVWLFIEISSLNLSMAMLLFGWLVAGVASFLEAGALAAALTMVVPTLFVAVAISTWNALKLAGSIPFLLPGAFVIVFIPLLTQELWVLGDEIGSQLVFLGLVVLGPPVLVLALRYWKTDVRQELVQALVRVNTPGLREELLAEIKAEPWERKGDVPADDWMWSKLCLHDSAAAGEAVDAIASDLAKSFRWQTLLRMAQLTVGVWTLFATFIYLLAWAAIPLSTSSRWTGKPLDVFSVDVFGWAVSLPTGPYISLAILLAVVATAAVMALALTEDPYADAVSDALVQRPAATCVMLGVPYRILFGDLDTLAARPDSSVGRAQHS